jgi:5-methylcytosine-specific restriction enzyme A
MLGDRVPTLGLPLPEQSRLSWRTGKTTTERGYDMRWRRFRAHWLRRHPLCGDREGGRSIEHSQCARDGRAVAASVCDHINPHRGDQDAFWAGPFQSLCSSCHGRKQQAVGEAQR